MEKPASNTGTGHEPEPSNRRPPEEKAGLGVSVRSSWRQAHHADHFVQFYRDDAVLIESVTGFIALGLRTTEGGIVIATAAHRQAIEARLEAQGIDLRMARARKQYIPLDAVETLARFMVNGLPDERLFNQVVGSVMLRMMSAGFRVRAYGEMVALLWAEGNPAAAIRLEQFWNTLGKTQRFSLFCAYPMAHFENGVDAAGFQHVCAMHAGFIPVEDAADRGAPAPVSGSTPPCPGNLAEHGEDSSQTFTR